jgi:hypothetical protein
MNAPPFYDIHAAADRLERERQLIARGIDPFACAARSLTVRIKPSLSTPQPGSFAQQVVNAIATKLGAKRYTKPTEPEGEPSDFAEALRRATERQRRGYPKVASQPKKN